MSQPVPSSPAALPPLSAEDLAHVLAHTEGLWEELRGQRIFLTGGTGFFGVWLLETFAHVNDTLDLGAHATVLSRDPAAFRKMPHLGQRGNIHFVAGDVREFVFPAGSFPFVIHAAAEASARAKREAPQEMFDVIVAGTRRVLDFAGQAGSRKILLISSGAVYGRLPPELARVPEDFAGAPDPLRLDSAYGVAKRAAEHMTVVHADRHGSEAKIARGFAFVGPHLPLDGEFAIGNFVRDALRGGSIRVAGDGTPFRSYLYGADLAVWLWTILFRGAAARAYNVGSSRELTIFELANEVSAVFGGRIAVQVAQPAPRGHAPSRYVPSVDRARLELALEDRIAIRESIARTVEWYRPIFR